MVEMREFRNINVNETAAFQYLQIPCDLVSDPYFGIGSPFGKPLSGDAKILYSLMLNRTGLSIKNSWITDTGDVYIIFPVKEIEEAISCAHQKAVKITKELEDFGLISKKRRGQGKPDYIFVKAFYGFKDQEADEPKEKEPESMENTEDFQKYDIHTSRSVNIIPQEVCKSYPIYNYKYKTNLDNYYLLQEDSDVEAQKERIKTIKEKIDYERLKEKYDDDTMTDIVDAIDYVFLAEGDFKVNHKTISFEKIKEQFEDINYDVVEVMLSNASGYPGYKHRNYYIYALYNQCLVKDLPRGPTRKNRFNDFPQREHPPGYYEELEKMLWGRSL